MTIRSLAIVLVCSAALCGLPSARCVSADAGEPKAADIWTAIIPDAFPRYVYTWRLDADGRYREDGRDAATSMPIQPTLHGRWSRDGMRMILRQDDLPYVFDGVVLGNLYAGTLDLDGRFTSRFCAARGERPPRRCEAAGVAAAGRDR